MTLLSHAPQLTLLDAEHLARDLFGVTATASTLPSERDQNFRLRTEEGRGLVLKIANAAETLEMLAAEIATMRQLASTGLAPTLVPTRSGDDIGRHRNHYVRLITALDGRPLGDTARQSDALLHDLGRAVGLMDRALEGFDHPALHRAFYWDLATAPAVIAERLPLVRDTALRQLIERVMAVHDKTVTPHLASFRRSAIHGDANDYNVLVDARTQRVTGIVDFGDMVVSHTVNDAAIAMAYAALGKSDPLHAAAQVAAGYHAVNPFTEGEIAALLRLDAAAPGPERVRGRRAAGGEARDRSTWASARRPSATRCPRWWRCTPGWRTTACARRWGWIPFRTRHPSSSGFAPTATLRRRSPDTT